MTRHGRPDDGDPLLPAILAGALDPADDRVLDLDSRLAAARRPLLVGGAITSAALSLVGVAWVAWRATRPGGRPALGASPVNTLARAAARLARTVDVGPTASDVDALPGGFGGLS